MSRRERLEKLGNQPKKFTNVYVKNFGEDMDEDRFKTLVDKFGKVLSLKVVVGDQGNAKGFGFVSFETPEEAQDVSKEISLLSIPDIHGQGVFFSPLHAHLVSSRKLTCAGHQHCYELRLRRSSLH